jgi:hypothetical protein
MAAVKRTIPPAAAGLFEAHLTVSDLDRSIAFYRDILGLQPAPESRERGAAFFWIGAPGNAMLGLWSLGSAPMGSRCTWRSRPPWRTWSAPVRHCGRSASRRSRSSAQNDRAERHRLDARSRRVPP